MTTSQSSRGVLLVYSAWLLLLVFAAFTAWQLHTALLVGAAAWLTSDLPRPLGWTQSTLVAISKLSLFVFGSIWLVFSLYMERSLNRSLGRGRIRRSLLHFVLLLSGLLAASYALILITS